MALAGIEHHRRQVARAVRRNAEPRDRPIDDIDVAIYENDVESSIVDSDDHRRLACEAKTELWRHIATGEISNAEDDQPEAVQCFEEWSHIE